MILGRKLQPHSWPSGSKSNSEAMRYRWLTVQVGHSVEKGILGIALQTNETGDIKQKYLKYLHPFYIEIIKYITPEYLPTPLVAEINLQNWPKG